MQAGIYTNDFVSIFQNLTLQAVGGPVRIVATVDPPNGKAIIDEGGAGISVTINGFDISGVVVPDGNGAAIRYEGGTLTLSNDYFHGNQDGLLGAPDPNGSITIDSSEFAFNGDGSGSTHNIYVGAIASFTITNSYIHDANVGHEIKSRAANNVIENNRIFDNNSTASYSIDLPNGGDATISGNVIEQGPNTQNPYIIAYGEEGASNPGTSVAITGNTIVNDDPSGRFLLDPPGTPVSFTDNSVDDLTDNQLSNGTLAESGTTFLTTEPTLNTTSTWDIGIGALCFLAGTRIATPEDEARVEELAVGDVVRTVDFTARTITGDLVVTLADGQLSAQPVRWVGHRRIDLTRHPRPETVAPIRIERDAFADNVPHRDLLVSPDHAIFVDSVLICARQLVNGITIRREEGWSSVDYFHVELDAHAILLAEGLPAESYLDTGDRGFFANAGSAKFENGGIPMLLHPQCTARMWETNGCAPLIVTGPILSAVRARLAQRTVRLAMRSRRCTANLG